MWEISIVCPADDVIRRNCSACDILLWWTVTEWRVANNNEAISADFLLRNPSRIMRTVQRREAQRLLPKSPFSWGWLYSPSGFQPHWSLRTFPCTIPCVSVCECVFLQAEKQVHLTNCSNVMAPTREPAALAPTSSRQMKKVTDRLRSLWRLQVFLSLWEGKKKKKRSRIR